MLDAKCTEYLTQLEKSAQNFEGFLSSLIERSYNILDFKHKIFDQDSSHQEEIRRLEEKVRNLNETVRV